MSDVSCREEDTDRSRNRQTVRPDIHGNTILVGVLISPLMLAIDMLLYPIFDFHFCQ